MVRLWGQSSLEHIRDAEDAKELEAEDQCDQVWRNFATLAIFLKYLANVWRVNITFGNILKLFCYISMLLGKFCLL